MANPVQLEITEKPEVNANLLSSTPSKVFIFPYRNREPHRAVILSMLPGLLEGQNYQIMFVHQNDRRPFNRGAMKNLGFMHVKATYPQDYRSITLIFHDIDYVSYKKNQFSYDTKQGVVKHFFGYEGSLGGIFAIKAADFEAIGGFPNFWTWGREDNMLYMRARRSRLKIDYGEFVHGQKNANQIVGLWHGWDRLISPSTINNYDKGTADGYRNIGRPISCVEKIADRIYMVHVKSFRIAEHFKTAMKDARIANARQYRCMGPKRPRRKSMLFT